MGNTHSKKVSRTFSKSSNRQRPGTPVATATKEQQQSKATVETEGQRIRNNSVESNKSSLLPSSTSTNYHTTNTDLHESAISTQPFQVHGRWYQNFNTKYILPNDEQESDRLVQVHFIYKYLFGKNFSAPVKDLLSMKQYRRSSDSSWVQDIPPPRVLDIACGNGTWILEMATEFPESQFYGIDIATSYPNTVKPPNAFFNQCDVLQPNGLPFPDNHFDYIHMRQVYTCFSESDWITVIQEIKRLLKPGGYIELRDIDPMMGNAGPITHKFFERFPRVMKETHGVNITWSRHMFDILQECGDIVDVHRQILPLPFDAIGPTGNMYRSSLKLGLQSYRLFFEKCNEIEGSEYDKTINNIVQEAKEYHSFFIYYCCWGRKSLCNTEYHHQDPAESLANRRYSTRTNGQDLRRHSSASKRQSYCSTIIDSVQSPNLIPDTSSYSDDATTDKGTPGDDDKKSTQQQHQHQPNNRSPSFYQSYSKDQDQAGYGVENVSDIDQFIEGYED